MTGAAKNGVYLAAIVVLLLIIATMAYKFIVVGSTQKAEDGRIEILLEPGERDLMLKEMRAFVESLHLCRMHCQRRYEGRVQSSSCDGDGKVAGRAARNDRQTTTGVQEACFQRPRCI